MTNLTIEILFWAILVSYLGLRFSRTRDGFKKEYQEGKMKLQRQFKVPNQDLRDLDYVNKVEVLEETFKRECQDYPTKEDCLVCCN